MTFINTTTNSTTIGQLLGVEPLVECLATPSSNSCAGF